MSSYNSSLIPSKAIDKLFPCGLLRVTLKGSTKILFKISILTLLEVLMRDSGFLPISVSCPALVEGEDFEVSLLSDELGVSPKKLGVNRV